MRKPHKLLVKLISLHVMLPVLLGASIYILWRAPTLLVFHWFEALSLSSLILHLRGLAEPLLSVIPKWFLFSLPDALWVYSLTAAMTLLWRGSDDPRKRFWIGAGLMLGVGGEVLQFWKIIPGTFDLQDLCLCFAGSGLAYLLVSICLVEKRDKKAYA